jgi:hypothetical protein
MPARSITAGGIFSDQIQAKNAVSPTWQTLPDKRSLAGGGESKANWFY